MVGPHGYGFYPINQGILRIDGKCRHGTKKVQTALLSSNVERGLCGTVGRVVVSHSAFNSGSECSGEDK